MANSLGQNVEAFIRLHSNWLIYVRLDRRFPLTKNWDFQARDSGTRDSASFGTGFKTQLEKHPVRLNIRPMPLAAPTAGLGFLSNYPVIIYSDVHHIPAYRDLFFEVEWDVSQDRIEQFGQPVRLLHTYEIQMVVPFRESGVSFFASGCNTYDFDQNLLENILLQRRF